jgi:phage antirepressor YoqD-like protein
MILPEQPLPYAVARLQRDQLAFDVALSDKLADAGAAPELIAQARIMESELAAFDRLARARGGLNLTDAAKVLETAPKKLIGWLLGHDWIFREPGGQLAGYQKRLETGHLKQKTIPIYRPDGSEALGLQVFVTAKGLAQLARDYGEGI